MVDLAGISFRVDTAGLQQGSAELDKFNQSQKNVTQGAREFNSAQQTVSTNTSSTAKAFAEINNVASGTVPAFGNASRAANALSEAHLGAAASTRSFREAVRVLETAAFSAGVPIQGLGIFAGAARAGFVGLGIALGASLIVALEKAADDSRILKGRLQDLLGLNAGGAVFGTLQREADKAHTTAAAIEPIVEEIIRAQNQINYASGFRAGFGEQANDAGKFTSAVRALTEAMQLNGMTGTAAAAAVRGFVHEILTIDPATGQIAGLTLDTFRKIEDASPGAARAIAEALGFGTTPQALAALEARLATGSMSFKRFTDDVVNNSDIIDKRFSELTPTISRSFDQLGNSLSKLKETFGQDFGSPISKSLEAVSTALNFLSDHADATRTAVSGIFNVGIGNIPILGTFISIIRGIDGIVAAAKSAIGWLQKLLSMGSPASGDTGFAPGLSFDATAAIDEQGGGLPQFAKGGLSIVSGTGGTDSQLVQFMATPGEVVAVGMPGSSPGSSRSNTVTNIAGQAMSVAQSLAQLNNAIASAAQQVRSGGSALAGASLGAASAVAGMTINFANGGRTVPWRGWTDTSASSGDYGATPVAAKSMVDQRLAYPMGAPVAYPSYGPQQADRPISVPMGFPTDRFSPPDYIGGGIYDDTSYGGYSDYSGGGSYDESGDSYGASDYTDYGFFARGGSFRVGGSGGTDTRHIGMHVTPGERVSVTPNDTGSGRNPAKVIGRTRSITLKLAPGDSGKPPAFIMSQAQMQRAMAGL